MEEQKTSSIWPILAETLSAGASVYLLLYVLLEFKEPVIFIPLTAAVAAALLAGGGTARTILRGVLFYPLLATAVLITPLAALAAPLYVVIGLAGGLTLPFALRRATWRKRCVWSLPGLAVMALAVFGPFTVFPEAGYRYVVAYGLMVLVAALAVARPAGVRRPAALLLLIFSVTVTPGLASRFLPCDQRMMEVAAAQPGVEVLFDNETSLGIPEHRMEILCDAGSGIRVVTPHDPSHRVGILYPTGRVDSVVLYGEGSTKSTVYEGKLYTSAKGAINAIDLVTVKLRRGPRLAMYNFGTIHLDAQADLFTMVEDQGENCQFARRSTLGSAGMIPMTIPGECIPLGDGLLLLSEVAWPGRRLAVIRMEDRAVLRETRFVDAGFLDVAVDFERKRIYAPSTLLGIVRVLDLDTLERVDWFFSKSGVRGALVDPSGKRLFTFTYFGGQLLEHELPGGKVLRRWELGTPLRGLNWDCDGKTLLAASCLGGFRIHVDQ